ncbi:hypothetical protein IGI04_007644, partial [Brassica rapa subsp. trilocularis]
FNSSSKVFGVMIWMRKPTLMKRADAAVSREPEGCKVLGKRLSLCNSLPSHMGYSIERLPLLLCEVGSPYYCHFWEIGEGILLEKRLGYLHSTFFLRRKGRDPPASSLSRATGRFLFSPSRFFKVVTTEDN